MLAFAAALVLQAATLPEKPVVAYSGIPSVSGSNVVIQSHTVNLSIFKDYVDVSSLTLVKNSGPAGAANINVGFGSLGGAQVPTALTATWAGKPLVLTQEKRMDQLSGIPPMDGAGAMQNLGTYALRISYRVPLGKCGFDHKQRLAAYGLLSSTPIGTLMVTYQYAPGVVFHEPEAGPNLGWQVGLKGAFLKLNNYDGKADVSYCAFYPGGFK
jgi:hypothetical protein